MEEIIKGKKESAIKCYSEGLLDCDLVSQPRRPKLECSPL
jgi:hypothetical protein